VKQYTGKVNTGFYFILLQTILYSAFLILDLTGGNYLLSNRIKFSIIVLCFCYALFCQKGVSRGIIFYRIRNCVLYDKKRSALDAHSAQNANVICVRKYVDVADCTRRESLLQQTLYCIRLALLFTVISDLFILILDYYFYGVLTFIIVQQLYGLRNSMVMQESRDISSNRSLWKSFLLRLILQAVIAGALNYLLVQAGVVPEKLLIATVFYFVCIISNVIIAIKTAIDIRNKENLLFAVGMFLFLLCDINVGLFNLSGFVSMPKELYHILYACSSILMWAFYAPSQVLLTLSGGYYTGKINKNH